MFKNLVNKMEMHFDFTSKGIPVCETRIVREGSGMPWNNRIAIHPLGEGKFSIVALRGPDHPSRRLRLRQTSDDD